MVGIPLAGRSNLRLWAAARLFASITLSVVGGALWLAVFNEVPFYWTALVAIVGTSLIASPRAPIIVAIAFGVGPLALGVIILGPIELFSPFTLDMLDQLIGFIALVTLIPMTWILLVGYSWLLVLAGMHWVLRRVQTMR